MTKPNQIKLLPKETINELDKTGDYADHYPYAANLMETAFFLSTLTDSYGNGFIVRRSFIRLRLTAAVNEHIARRCETARATRFKNRSFADVTCHNPWARKNISGADTENSSHQIKSHQLV